MRADSVCTAHRHNPNITTVWQTQRQNRTNTRNMKTKNCLVNRCSRVALLRGGYAVHPTLWPGLWGSSLFIQAAPQPRPPHPHSEWGVRVTSSFVDPHVTPHVAHSPQPHSLTFLNSLYLIHDSSLHCCASLFIVRCFIMNRGLLGPRFMIRCNSLARSL